MKICKLCSKPRHTREWCWAHYIKGLRNNSIKRIVKPSGSGTITPYGYKLITVNGVRMLEHRYIMEQHVDRKLKPSEKVHHIDHNRLNNNIDNLKLYVSHSEHMRSHHGRKQLVEWNKIVIPPKIDRSKPYSMSKCIIQGCYCVVKMRGLCNKHVVSYYAWKRRCKTSPQV